MGISQATSAVMVFLTGLLPASCHKTTETKQTPPAQTIVATQSTNAAGTVVAKSLSLNLGEIALTNKNDFCIQINNGEFCTFTPKMLDQKNVRITLAVESKDKYGETSNFTVKQVTTQPGKPVEVAVGDLNLAFTPSIISAE
jgi:hypothetical protein